MRIGAPPVAAGRPGGDPLPVVATAVSVSFTALGTLLAGARLAGRDVPLPCPFRRLTGHPCPFCGTTTAAVDAVRQGLAHVPARSLPALAVVAALVVMAAWSGVTWWRRRRLPGRAASTAFVAVVAVGVAANWAVQLAGR